MTPATTTNQPAIMNPTEITKETLANLKRIVKAGIKSLYCDRYVKDWRRKEENVAWLSAGEEEKIPFAVTLTTFSPNSSALPIAKLYAYLEYNRAEMNTFISFLKVGDKVVFQFSAGNNSPAMEEAGFNADDLYVRIERGNKYYRILLHYEVTKKEHEPARMVRQFSE